MPLANFHPLVADWFSSRVGVPTRAQALGWPAIGRGRDTLIAAPTGSGKTLAAFLFAIDRLLRRALEGTLEPVVSVVYVSPLRALANDIHRNLVEPLAELLAAAGPGTPEVVAAVRTGDTQASARQRMVRRPPHILVTTPESLYLLLTGPRSREILRPVETVIVDEVHALAPDRRGAHLSLTLERLEALADAPPVRIGLSATQEPIERIGRFLVGDRPEPVVVDTGHLRELDLGVETPVTELGAVCTHDQWAEVHERLVELIESHRSTLVFVNTRRLAERVSHQLAARLGDDAVLPHHGSLSHRVRRRTEVDLKEGRLKAVVATASLELGLDVGCIDLVCQIGSPRTIATFLQRVGRSGHALGAIPRGRLFALTRDELIESLALLRAVRAGRLDAISVPEASLDVLAQQIVAEVACRDWAEDDLFDLVRRAGPYRALDRGRFDEILELLSEGVAGTGGRGRSFRRHLHRDRVGGMLKARRGSRLIATTCGGAIPETGEYRVVLDDEPPTVVGSVDEDFAIESMAGDVFLLGNHSWRIRHVRGGQVVVADAGSTPPTVPFWFGEGPGRSIELSEEVGVLRQELAGRWQAAGRDERAASGWLLEQGLCRPEAALQAVRYVAAQEAATGVVPTHRRVLFERFFDEAGGMQLVVHAPFGARVNRAWGLALRKLFCRTFNFELQASADDDGIVLSLGPQHSFPLERMFTLVARPTARATLVQAVLAVPFFGVRWRWVATRALGLVRWERGRRVPFPLQRMRADDLLAAVFPQQAACLEHIVGDIEVPDHPLVAQTLTDCLEEVMDTPAWLGVLDSIEAGRIEVVGIDTTEPSPFSHQRLNAMPYAFLDDAPLEERRARAVSLRRTLDPQSVADLGRLDPAAIARVRDEAWPLVRDADELHDALLSATALPAAEAEGWLPLFDELVAARRATRFETGAGPVLLVAAERLPILRAAFGGRGRLVPPIDVPAGIVFDPPDADQAAVVELVRGRLEIVGPTTAARVAAALGLDPGAVGVALVSLEGQGSAMRGRFTDEPDDDGPEWCDRRLLARIHRLTMAGLRAAIQPVAVDQFLRFLTGHQHLSPMHRRTGPEGLAEVLARLAGFEAPVGDWETRLLPARLEGYDPAWLDEATRSGHFVWARLVPRPSAGRGQPMRSLTRQLPIGFLDRANLTALLPERAADESLGRPLSSIAVAIEEALEGRGAQFVEPLAARLGLLPEQIESALGELAAAGRVTCDGFDGVRRLVRRTRSRPRSRRPATSGRWSLLAAELGPPPEREARLEAWARQLLTRYGVVFRDVLVREAAAPPWRDLVRVYRTLESRGEIRGGRFVLDVGGEQYALPGSIDPLRNAAPEGDPLIVAATDPVNLFGRITPGRVVDARRGGRLAIAGGRLVGHRTAGRIWTADTPVRHEVETLLARPARGEGGR